MKVFKKIISLLFFTLLLSCSGDYTGQELQKWLSQKENGLIQSVENEKFKIEIQYKPTEYMVAIENKNTILTKEELETNKKDKEGLQHFNIKLISKTGEEMLKTDLAEGEDYQRRKKYYLNDFENDILLVDGQDTVAVVLYHFEISYGAVSFNNISIAFENTHKEIKNKKIIILDRVLGFEKQEFNFSKEDLQKIPHLKTK